MDGSSPARTASSPELSSPEVNVSMRGWAADFIASELKSGRYADAESLVADALARLEDELPEEQLSPEAFEQMMDESIAAVDRGDYEEVQVDDLERWMRSLGEDVPST